MDGLNVLIVIDIMVSRKMGRRDKPPFGFWDALTWALKKLLNKTAWQVVILTLIVSSSTTYASYHLIFKDKLEEIKTLKEDINKIQISNVHINGKLDVILGILR